MGTIRVNETLDLLSKNLIYCITMGKILICIILLIVKGNICISRRLFYIDVIMAKYLLKINDIEITLYLNKLNFNYIWLSLHPINEYSLKFQFIPAFSNSVPLYVVVKKKLAKNHSSLIINYMYKKRLLFPRKNFL